LGQENEALKSGGVQSLFARALLALTCRLRGSNTLQLLDEIKTAPFLAPEQIRQKQFERLSLLLAHAQAHVPYYHEMFKSLHISSQDVRSWSDFQKLPVLTKQIVRERARDLVRDDVPLECLMTHFSGGSTGVPLKFYRSREYLSASDAGVYRNFMQCGWRPGEMIAYLWGGNERLYAMSRFEFELRQHLRRMYQFDAFHSGPQEMAMWAKRFSRLRPSVILGYASTVARFAEFLQIEGRKLPRLRGVFTSAEKLYQPQREVIERVFECRVFDLYGSSEVQNIAAECCQGSMHINADFVVVEEDAPTHGDAPRPLLLTSLWNCSMPFVRYRNEDCGYLVDEICGCGNNFPLMRLEIARISDNFILPDGRVVHGEFFTHLMYGSEGILSFQFHQTAPDRIVLWIVPGPGKASIREQNIRKAIQMIRELSPAHGITVDVCETTCIPLSAAGKHRFTRSDVSQGERFVPTTSS
jgi:phenylacetate-CoA ligase